LISNTTTLRPFKRILPIGFQSDYAVRVKPAMADMDRILDELAPDGGSEQPFEIPVSAAEDLLRKIEPTLEMDTDQGYFFDWQAARAALAHMSHTSSAPQHRGAVWCLLRKDRNISRFINAGGRETYADAPDTTHQEGRIARSVAIHIPMLMLFRQNGAEDRGWRGTPFYWPVIWAPQNTRTTIFAHETTN
jgi:hypothetical protein